MGREDTNYLDTEDLILDTEELTLDAEEFVPRTEELLLSTEDLVPQTEDFGLRDSWTDDMGSGDDMIDFPEHYDTDYIDAIPDGIDESELEMEIRRRMPQFSREEYTVAPEDIPEDMESGFAGEAGPDSGELPETGEEDGDEARKAAAERILAASGHSRRHGDAAPEEKRGRRAGSRTSGRRRAAREEEDEEEDDDDEFSLIDFAVITIGVIVAAVVIVFGIRMFGSRKTEEEVASFARIGTEFMSADVLRADKVAEIGENYSLMLKQVPEPEPEVEQEPEIAVEETEEKKVVELKLSSVQRDLKIKFINSANAALITGVPFKVRVTDPSGKETEYTNDDRDGIIYRKNLNAGTYKVTMVPFEETDEDYPYYDLPEGPHTIEVKAEIAYERIDVQDEIKDASQVNVAQEDTAHNIANTVIESVITDTVEWVESTKTEVTEGGIATTADDYVEVPKSDIPDPSKKQSRNTSGPETELPVAEPVMLASAYQSAEPAGEEQTPAEVIPEGGGENTEPPAGGEGGGNEGGGGSETPDPPPVEPPAPQPATVTGISLSTGSLSGKVGESGSISATVSYSDGSSKTNEGVSFSSSDGSVCTVSGGSVSFVGPGTATVTASIGEYSAQASVTVEAVPAPVVISAVTVNPGSLSGKAGESGSISATVSYSDGSTKTNEGVSFSSSNPAVAEVDGSGTVRYIGAGTATVTASAGDYSAQVSVTVEAQPIPVTVSSVTVNPTSLSGKIGESGRITATVYYSDGSTKTNEGVSFSSKDSNIASAAADGTVSYKAKGETTVTVSAGDKSASVTVTVQDNEQTSYKVNISGDSAVSVGNTIKLTASTDPKKDGAGFAWSSSDRSVAEVGGDGTVKGIKAGKADITASVKIDGKDYSGKVTITVTDQRAITLDTDSFSIKVGDTKKVNATVTGLDNKEVTWASSNAVVFTVDANGNVKGIAPGDGTLTVTSKADANLKKEIKVTVTIAANNSDPLKDIYGNQLYILKADGSYAPATVADYYTADRFFRLTTTTKQYRYTGWQTINGRTYFYDKNGVPVTGEQIIQGITYTFGADGALNTGNTAFGIDVSQWNGVIDWNAVRNAGVSYAIIRCGYRGSTVGALVKDSQFRANIAGAQAAGIKVGVYFFTQAVDEVEAVEEASMVLSMVSGYSLQYPIFLDVESSGGRADGISAATRTAVCRAFCRTIANSGYRAGIYANKNWFSEKIYTSQLSNYTIWLAQYAAQPTYNATRYDIWQYSPTGKIPGIPEKVDLNISYLGY